MKKFFLCVFILMIFSGFVFFIGWTQIRVKPDSMGVVISKLRGVDETPVLPGVFSYHKDFLLPTNAELKVFQLKPYAGTNVISGELPSSDFYNTSNVYKFSYNFVFSVEAHVTPEMVIDLLKRNVIFSSEDLPVFLEKQMDSVCQDCANLYLKKACDNPDFRVYDLTIVDLFKECNLAEKYADIEIDVLALTNSQLPDYEMYNYLRKNLLSGVSESEQTKINEESKENAGVMEL